MKGINRPDILCSLCSPNMRMFRKCRKEPIGFRLDLISTNQLKFLIVINLILKGIQKNSHKEDILNYIMQILRKVSFCHVNNNVSFTKWKCIWLIRANVLTVSHMINKIWITKRTCWVVYLIRTSHKMQNILLASLAGMRKNLNFVDMLQKLYLQKKVIK
jgi:hypothetical protein